MGGATVHTHASGETGIFVNAYVIETASEVVVVDATLTVSDAKALRRRVEALGKPLRAVLLTHGHPDHYNGLTELVGPQEVPIVSTQGVLDVIQRTDAMKEQQWRPVFKDEWPARRTFPNRVVHDQQALDFGGVRFVVHDLGPGESHADSCWVMHDGAQRCAFIGDVVLHQVHAYLADGHSLQWLRNLELLKSRLHDVERLYPGHGPAGGLELLDWQQRYIQHYHEQLKDLLGQGETLSEEATAQLSARMRAFLPNDRLMFLVPLSAEAVAKELIRQPA